MLLNNGKLLNGEGEIWVSKEIDQGYKDIYLEPSPQVDPHAVQEIMDADLIVFGPGGLYTSLIPNLLVDGIAKALRETKAEKVFIVNLMNKRGQTTGFKSSDYLKKITKFIGKDVFDLILVNKTKPTKELIEVYAKEGGMVENDIKNGRVILADLLSAKKNEIVKGDTFAAHRNLIRHDHEKIAEELMKIVDNI